MASVLSQFAKNRNWLNPLNTFYCAVQITPWGERNFTLKIDLYRGIETILEKVFKKIFLVDIAIIKNKQIYSRSFFDIPSRKGLNSL
jgi:hypothetical protein